MKKILIFNLVGSLVFLTGCTTFVCRFQKNATQRVADTIADTLQCSNRQQVFEDVDYAIKKLAPCKQRIGMQGPVADLVCPTISKWVSEFVVDKAVPDNWQCKSDGAKVLLTSQVERVCKMIPLSEVD